MNPAQTARARDYNAIPQSVLDDLTVFSRALPAAERIGAGDLLLYILAQRSAARRDKARGEPQPAKGKIQ